MSARAQPRGARVVSRRALPQSHDVRTHLSLHTGTDEEPPPIIEVLAPADAVVVPLAALQAAVEAVVRYAFDDALADRMAEAIAGRLGAHVGGMSAEVYSSNKRGPHIPGKSRQWMVRNVRTMPGARKVGRDWTISRTDCERWMTEKDVQECRAATTPAPTSAREIALNALARAGLRATNKG